MRIDTHQHILPPFYSKWLTDQGIKAAGGRELPEWSASAALDFMHEANIQTGLVSVSTPGTHLGDDASSRTMTRNVNEFCARLCADHPGRFGFFASLPLPDVGSAMAEAIYALDTLKATGVVLLANVRGTYFGCREWEPLMEVLQERQAVVFIHPSELPGPGLEEVPSFAADFLLDTTRAAIKYARSGGMERYPDVKVILSHAGGFLPYAAERIARVCSPDESYEAGLQRLRQYYFDTALSSSHFALPSLLAFADPTHITYGTDWPFAPKERSLHFKGLLDSYALPQTTRAAMDSGNALALFPSLASHSKFKDGAGHCTTSVS